MKQGTSSESSITCPLCKNTQGTCLVENISYEKIEEEDYDIYFCPNCNGEFSWPMKPMNYDSDSEALDTQYDQFNGLMRESLRRNFVYACMATFLDSIKGGKTLDVGAGLGVFLTHAYNLGFDPYGIDVSQQYVRFLKTKLPFARIALADNIFTPPEDWPKSYQVISALDVFEHVAMPFELGKQIYGSLAPGGYFLMSVPNRERYYYKFGRRIDDFIIKNADEPPYHLTKWRKKTVQSFLERIGFEEYCLVTGGLLWRKNISIKGNHSKLLSSLPRSLYRLSSIMPLALLKVIENWGTHFIVFAQKEGGLNEMSLEMVKREVLTRVYKRRIPFFIECELK